MAKNKEVVVRQTGALPAMAEAPAELLERVKEVRDNMESIENFRLPRCKMTPEGFELIEGEPAIKELTGVILHSKKSNIFYENVYDASNVTPPDCFSLDGETPDASVKNPQSKHCKGCPKAQFGTNARKSGKACRNMKPLYLLLSDEAIMPRQLLVTPSSLRAANQYLMDLTERGLSYRKVRTRVEAYKENPKDTYCKLKFSLAGKLDDVQKASVEYLRGVWLPVMNAQNVDANEVLNENEKQEAAKEVPSDY